MGTAIKLASREDEVGKEVGEINEQAKSLKIVDAKSYINAGELWKSIKALRKKVDDTFGPIISTAFQAHRTAVAKKKEVDGPLESAERIVKQAMSAYDAEQERIRREEERRLAEIARKAEEERRIQEAIAAEEEARRNGATKEEAAIEVEEILSEPVYVAPVVVPKATPKMQGGPVYRTVWKFRITDAAKIPREYLTPDTVKIGAVARAMKKLTNIPGVQAYEERC